MKTVNRVSKKCWVCNNTKFLNQFEIDQDTTDKHANICNECLKETGKQITLQLGWKRLEIIVLIKYNESRDCIYFETSFTFRT
jgi:hypothetical protein